MSQKGRERPVAEQIVIVAKARKAAMGWNGKNGLDSGHTRAGAAIHRNSSANIHLLKLVQRLFDELTDGSGGEPGKQSPRLDQMRYGFLAPLLRFANQA